MRNKLFLVFLAILTTQCLVAAVRLPSLISDRMVLQRDIELKIWGWADKGEKVTVRFQEKHYYTEAGADGKWQVILPAQKAGGPYLMEINALIIRDILIGDVWLCSGQSNMETPIARLVEKFPEISVSNNHMIRHFKVPTQNTVESVQDNTADGGKWYSAIASDVMNWTALAYFYAQEAYQHNGVPVGMLVSSLGGSAIESWISQEHLIEFPSLLVDQEALKERTSAEADKGAGLWSRANWDDTAWDTMQMPGLWRDNGLLASGVVYYRKDFTVPTTMDGRHAKLYMGMLIDSDSIFINGHFVGTTGYMYPPRKYDIPAGVLKAGQNNITVKLTANRGNGGFVRDKSYKIVGDDAEIDLHGTWKYRVAKNLSNIKRVEEKLVNLKSAGSGLYNGMIYPIRDYNVRGAIWYQGESNAGQPHTYETYLKSLITSWRALYQWAEMPFLLVQLPNYMEKSAVPQESGWAKIREAQFKTALEVPHTAMAVTYDVGEWNDIHPLNKKDVAQRLFLGARKLVYDEKLLSSGPLYKDMKIAGDKIVLSFTEVGAALVGKGGALRHFAIAGADKKFFWAEAVIKGNKVIVGSRDVSKPVAVRYAWSDNPEDANLMNKEGLLASPFRTDNW
ncbi:sialate O-acetylesterase [Sphingobacterium pedocola]|uniref:Sialate O-acetylesterase n=1 Tax=Sphingobacterium pedocola TaxID=2082722 RepID=A0ABR9T4W9_9SPHI|nr:sialate O-acetylesterase [Sphingobacterium pedocola]MBE8720386.1 sialate O-acetylesterase [Sphingobacterium pedocola]